jgi:hypothetical protein
VRFRALGPYLEQLEHFPAKWNPVPPAIDLANAARSRRAPYFRMKTVAIATSQGQSARLGLRYRESSMSKHPPAFRTGADEEMNEVNARHEIIREMAFASEGSSDKRTNRPRYSRCRSKTNTNSLATALTLGSTVSRPQRPALGQLLLIRRQRRQLTWSYS